MILKNGRDTKAIVGRKNVFADEMAVYLEDQRCNGKKGEIEVEGPFGMHLYALYGRRILVLSDDIIRSLRFDDFGPAHEFMRYIADDATYFDRYASRGKSGRLRRLPDPRTL